jgi:hypothetical protein
MLHEPMLRLVDASARQREFTGGEQTSDARSPRV